MTRTLPLASVITSGYLYADVGDLTRDSLAFCRELLDATGVALNTGRDFDGLHGDRYVRISFAVTTAETLRSGVLYPSGANTASYGYPLW